MLDKEFAKFSIQSPVCLTLQKQSVSMDKNKQVQRNLFC